MKVICHINRHKKVNEQIISIPFEIFQLNLGIFTMDKRSELSVLVDRATGGASIEDGQLELMLHRFK